MLIKKSDLIMPYFVIEGRHKIEPITSMPGIARFSIDNLLKDIAGVKKLGVEIILLFGVCPTELKDVKANYAYSSNTIIAEAVRLIKREIKDITVITDVCLCAYTTHGHCGIIESQSAGHRSQVKIDNKETLRVLSEIALKHAEAGVDWVAPSAMAKKQVCAIRKSLDKNGFKKTKILGYSAKFASNFYGPFRNACASSPAFGDRSSYQLGFDSLNKALDEIKQDIVEGADIVMVKPALTYLDVIHEAKKRFSFPLAAYLTSGEYAFVEYGARQKLWDRKKVTFEIISALRRAGTDFIITYHAQEIAKWLSN